MAEEREGWERRGRDGRVIHRLLEKLQGTFLYYIKETFAKLKERLKDVRNNKKKSVCNDLIDTVSSEPHQ